MVIYGWLKVALCIFCIGKLAGSIFQLAACFDFYNVYLRFRAQIALSTFTHTEHGPVRIQTNILQSMSVGTSMKISCVVFTYDLSRQEDLIYFEINEDKLYNQL